ncbi:hypothetical protein [Paraburkholderia adhaesiva]|uniref:hypothetical protein n=1 Tax=Paraburkholderia adhaesiva TaxID=2883244 RepID=UPI001F180A34|nr:hypothetical protein [Paraburkholderia adhaesiva]
MMDVQPFYHEPLWVFAAGISGALVRVVVMAPPGTLMRIAHLATGALMALFVAPAIDLHWLSTDSLEMQRAVAFAIGALGPLIVEILIHLVQRRGDSVADRMADRFARRFGDRAGHEPGDDR